MMGESAAYDITPSPPQPLRGEFRAVPKRAELGPYHALLDEHGAGEGAEAAVDARQDARLVADGLGGRHDPVGDDLRMFDDVSRRVYDAGQEEHGVGQRMAAEGFQLVLVP